MKYFRTRLRIGLALPALVALASASILAMPWSDTRAGTTATYSIDFHTISSGGSSLRNSCYHLTGTVGQAAPGYSSTTSGTPTYSVYAGFWSAAPATGLDEIFFNGFEEC